MNRKETPISAGLMENGKIKSVLTVTRRRPPGASNSAKPSAIAVVKPTVKTVNAKVTVTEFQKSGAPLTAQAKFSSPTKAPGTLDRESFQTRKLRISDCASGQTAVANTTAIAGNTSKYFR